MKERLPIKISERPPTISLQFFNAGQVIVLITAEES